MTPATLPRSKTRHGTAYHEAGTGEPVILIHGVGLRLEAWTPQITALAAGHRVIAVDMPGHGESAPIAAGARLPAFVAWLGEVLDDLGLTAINIAGHSMGALIAGGAAAEFGARVARVALVNGVYRRDAEARAAVIARAQRMASGIVDIEGPLQRWFEDDEETARDLTRSWLSSVNPVHYATAYTAFAHGDAVYADAWTEIGASALFLTGSGDPNSTPAMAEAMAKAARRGKAVIIAGHRHMVTMTAPETVNTILATWLNS